MLELSLREALQLGHNYIGTEHLLLGLLREGEGVGSSVLVALAGDLSKVRHEVIRLMSLPSAGKRIEQPDVTHATVQGSPRCPTCRALLEGHAGYRILPVQRVDERSRSESIDVVFVYCLRCGVVVAHAPTETLKTDPVSPSDISLVHQVHRSRIFLLSTGGSSRHRPQSLWSVASNRGQQRIVMCARGDLERTQSLGGGRGAGRGYP